MQRIQRLIWFLEAHFGEVEFHMPDAQMEAEADPEEEEEGTNAPMLVVSLDEADALINLITMVGSSSLHALYWLTGSTDCIERL
jgi:cleavage and polyadenylation specificity factor subunit 3